MKALIGVALCVLVGCQEDAPKAPNSVLPQSGKVIAGFRLAKDTCETRAGEAKEDFRRSRERQAKELYSDAAAAHNALITRIILAVENRDDSLEQELEGLLADADSKAVKFLGWYKRVTKRDSRGGHGGGGYGAGSPALLIEPILSALGIGTEVWKIKEEKDAKRREVFRKQLEECKWLTWGEL